MWITAFPCHCLLEDLIDLILAAEETHSNPVAVADADVEETFEDRLVSHHW